jgi:hypothetical protein
MWLVVLKDGRYFTAGNEGDGLLSASMELQERGIISSDYEILSITALEH